MKLKVIIVWKQREEHENGGGISRNIGWNSVHLKMFPNKFLAL